MMETDEFLDTFWHGKHHPLLAERPLRLPGLPVTMAIELLPWRRARGDLIPMPVTGQRRRSWPTLITRIERRWFKLVALIVGVSIIWTFLYITGFDKQFYTKSHRISPSDIALETSIENGDVVLDPNGFLTWDETRG